MQGKKDAKLAKRLSSELEWVRSNAKGRQVKSKARLARYEEMVNEAEKTRKLDFEELVIPVGPRLGSQVIDAKNLQKGFDGRILIDGLSFTLPRNGIVGVIGPNGVGKTTLFKTIVGFEPLDGGDLKIGETVDISYVDQNRGGIDPNKTLWEVVSDGQDYIQVGKTEIPSRGYVSQFGFKGPDQQKKAGVLSGGERNRLNLALTLKQGGNLLLLDEPTNDLDVETLGSLENALLEFPGCAVVITHDRWFLDRIATHILAYEGTDENPSNWYWFEGNFEAYEENKIERLGPDAAKPHRMHVPQAHPGLIVRLHQSRSRCAGPTSTPTRTSTTPRCSASSRRRASRRSGAATTDRARHDTAVLDARPGAEPRSRSSRARRSSTCAPIPYMRAPIDIELWIGRLGGASLEVCYEVYSPDGVEPRVLYTKAATTLVMVERATGTPVAHHRRAARGLGALRRGARRVHPAPLVAPVLRAAMLGHPMCPPGRRSRSARRRGGRCDRS